jgi:hypothetical protein
MVTEPPIPRSSAQSADAPWRLYVEFAELAGQVALPVAGYVPAAAVLKEISRYFAPFMPVFSAQPAGHVVLDMAAHVIGRSKM